MGRRKKTAEDGVEETAQVGVSQVVHNPNRPTSTLLGVSRSVAACQRCRVKKTKCDQKFPACTNCEKAGVECIGLDPATGREVPRSYVSHLEDRVAFLELQLQARGVVDYDLNYVIPDSASDQWKHPMPLIGTQSHAQLEILQRQGQVGTVLGVGSISESGVNSDMNKGKGKPGDSISSGRDAKALNNRAVSAVAGGTSYGGREEESQLSAVSGKNSSGLNNRKSQKMNSSLGATAQQPQITDNLMSNVELGALQAGSSAPPTYLGSSSGLSFARLMFTALKLRPVKPRSSKNHSKEDEKAQPVTDPSTHTRTTTPAAPLPTKAEAEHFLNVFFSQANPQLPVVHREQFVERYFYPVYGALSEGVSLASDYTLMNLAPCAYKPEQTYYYKYCKWKAENDDLSRKKKSIYPHSPTPPPVVMPSLYFLNIVFAIATSVHHQKFNRIISESYRMAAAAYMESVYSSNDRLEALQGILLLALYSIMRPAVPGVWYVLGSALRLCVDLGLHTEAGMRTWTNNTPKSTASSETLIPSKYDAFELDMRRRLFWCTYALDRQICVYLDRPFGIPQECVKVPFPSELDDALIIKEQPSGGKVTDYSLQSSTMPSYKNISLSFFRIRLLQAEIQTILYDCGELPRRFATLEEWRDTMNRRLEEWRKSVPKTLRKMNCNFNLTFFDLNYHQTRLSLFGLCPRNPTPSPDAFLIIADAGEKVIQSYYQLHKQRSINYTWVAVHNLFMAGTSYLYALYHSPEVRNKYTMEEIDQNTIACIHVLTGMIDRCDAAASSRDAFELLTAAILKLCFNEKSGGRKSSVDGNNDKTEGSDSTNDITDQKLKHSLPSAEQIAASQPAQHLPPHLENLVESLPKRRKRNTGNGDHNGSHSTNIKQEEISEKGEAHNSELPPEAMSPGSQSQSEVAALDSTIKGQPMSTANLSIDSDTSTSSQVYTPLYSKVSWTDDLDQFFREAALVEGISPATQSANSPTLVTNTVMPQPSLQNHQQLQASYQPHQQQPQPLNSTQNNVSVFTATVNRDASISSTYSDMSVGSSLSPMFRPLSSSNASVLSPPQFGPRQQGIMQSPLRSSSSSSGYRSMSSSGSRKEDEARQAMDYAGIGVTTDSVISRPTGAPAIVSNSETEQVRPHFINDGQRVYDMMFQGPLASIWDEFFGNFPGSGNVITDETSDQSEPPSSHSEPSRDMGGDGYFMPHPYFR